MCGQLCSLSLIIQLQRLNDLHRGKVKKTDGEVVFFLWCISKCVWIIRFFNSQSVEFDLDVATGVVALTVSVRWWIYSVGSVKSRQMRTSLMVISRPYQTMTIDWWCGFAEMEIGGWKENSQILNNNYRVVNWFIQANSLTKQSNQDSIISACLFKLAISRAHYSSRHAVPNSKCYSTLNSNIVHLNLR